MEGHGGEQILHDSGRAVTQRHGWEAMMGILYRQIQDRKDGSRTSTALLGRMEGWGAEGAWTSS